MRARSHARSAFVIVGGALHMHATGHIFMTHAGRCCFGSTCAAVSSPHGQNSIVHRRAQINVLNNRRWINWQLQHVQQACSMRGSPLQPTIIARLLQPTCKHPQALRLQHQPSSMPSRASRRRSATDIVFCAHLPMRGAGLLESLPQRSGGRGAGVPLSFESDNPFADSGTGSCRGCP